MRVKLESETECGMVLRADDPELLNKLDWAAEKGQLEGHWIRYIYILSISIMLYVFSNLPVSHYFSAIVTFCVAGLRVLLSHMELAVPRPELLSRLMRAAGCQIPGTRQCFQPAHPDFRLFLSTQLPASLLSTGTDC